jgi:low affinity Fe/Cu permease
MVPFRAPEVGTQNEPHAVSRVCVLRQAREQLFMAKKRAKASGTKLKNNAQLLHPLLVPNAGANGWSHMFSNMACAISHWAGKPLTFLVAVLIVLIWAASGPLFGYSDTWQLVINTSTTIITFLMVFLIQHTQNRDTLALQLKLAELIIAMKGAENEIATAEDLSEEELEQLHAEYRKRAEATLENLNRRRSQQDLKRAS